MTVVTTTGMPEVPIEDEHAATLARDDELIRMMRRRLGERFRDRLQAVMRAGNHARGAVVAGERIQQPQRRERGERLASAFGTSTKPSRSSASRSAGVNMREV